MIEEKTDITRSDPAVTDRSRETEESARGWAAWLPGHHI